MNKRLWRLAFLFLLLTAGGNVACSKQTGTGPVRDLSTLEGQWRDSVRTALADGYQNQKLVIGSYTMPIWWTVFGEKPADGRSLYISLHGGGGAPPQLNDQQWDNQKRLYQPAEGVYLCPRAITDTWDLHFRPESDAFYEAIIQMAVAYLDVNPDKVYLMGYSAGGDGVWREAPRMADHWAAASMMAGHPGDVSLLSLRNLPFMIWCGGEDGAYDRNKVCAERIAEMDALQAADPEGYIHEGHIVPGKPHWMDRVDTAAVAWMARFVRNPYPKRVVWCQGDVMKEYFYWLGVPVDEAKKGSVLRADLDGNTVTIGACDYSRVRVFLNEKMVDLSKPVVVKYGDNVLFEGILSPSEELRRSTLFTRNDLSYVFPCCVEVAIPRPTAWTPQQQKAAQTAAKATVNYDQDAVRPYTLEDPLRFADGRKVRSRKEWPARRQEILGIFQREMYGQMPPSSEIYTEIVEEGPTLAGFGTRRQLRMWFRPDRSGPAVDWLIVTPNHVQGPAPVVLLLNYGGNHEFLYDEEILVTEAWMREKHGHDGNRASAATRGRYNRDGDRYVYPVGMLVARGYAVMTACYCEISPDPDPQQADADGVILQDRFAYTGVFDLWGPRDPSRDDNTTSLGAWAWGLMRGMDWIERDPGLDASRVVLTGCSRLAKAALIAGAFDERFPLVVPVQTGGGGVPLAKRNFGETISTEVAAFRHWYCRAYDKYAGHEDEMPFDQHLLLSCVAPRALLVEGFDGNWFDTKGEFLSLQAASPVWKFLGSPALPAVAWPADYDLSAVGPVIGYVRRDQQHGISAIDWTWMLDFADRYWAR